jgi:hypothetical protein
VPRNSRPPLAVRCIRERARGGDGPLLCGGALGLDGGPRGRKPGPDRCCPIQNFGGNEAADVDVFGRICALIRTIADLILSALFPSSCLQIFFGVRIRDPYDCRVG